MLELSRLDPARQLNVGHALENTLSVNRPTPLSAATKARGEAVIVATKDLTVFAGPAPGQVDRATDTVLTAFDDGLEQQERALLIDAVVPLGQLQLQMLGRIRLVRASVFPHGTRSITKKTMDLEWKDLRVVRTSLQEARVAEAIDALGFRPLADHVLAHIAIYGRVIGDEAGSAGTAEEKTSLAWHEAFKLFVAQVMVDYDKDAAMQRELLGAYETQLDEQRASARAAVRARLSQGENKKPPEDSSSSAPPAG
jgi:hypothetical protein